MLMTTEKYDLIIIRGAPAVGKSSLGRRMKKEFPLGFVVEVDDVRGMINSVKWVHKEEHLNALNATEALVKSYLNASYKPAIIVDTFNPSKLKFFCEKFQNNNFVVISLYANNEVLENRLTNREKGFKDFEMSKILNDEVEKYRHEKEIFIDTSNLTKEQVAEKLIHSVSQSNNV
jgi:broad-specificity NMP kinase